MKNKLVKMDGMFDIYKSSDLKSFTVNIWTTP